MILALCVGLAACHAARNGTDKAGALATLAADASSVSSMLKDGKPEACAHTAVKARILKDIDEGLENPTPESLVLPVVGRQQDVDAALRRVPEPTLKDTQAVGSDNSIGAMACGTHAVFGDMEYAIEYTLKPSLDDPDDFLMAYQSGGDATGLRTRLVRNMASTLAGKRPKAEEASGVANQNGVTAAGMSVVRPAAPADGTGIWRDGGDLVGTCFAKVGRTALMDGPCEGAGHGNSIFVTADRDGCSIELNRHGNTVTGSLSAYRNSCGEIDSDVNLGGFTPAGDCWAGSTAKVCVKAGRGPNE